MAAKDMTLEYKHNRKRAISVGCYELKFGDITGDGSIVANLAPGSVPIGYTLVELSAVNTGATADVTLNGTLILNEVPLDSSHSWTDSAGVNPVVTDFTNGGKLVVKAGAVAPTAGSVRLMLYYIEYNKTTAEYTA